MYNLAVDFQAFIREIGNVIGDKYSYKQVSNVLRSERFRSQLLYHFHKRMTEHPAYNEEANKGYYSNMRKSAKQEKKKRHLPGLIFLHILEGLNTAPSPMHGVAVLCIRGAALCDSVRKR